MALVMPVAEDRAPQARFSETRRTDFIIKQPAEYVFSPSQATRDLARRHSILHGFQVRPWYSLAPQGGRKMPLVILLHGAGRDGLSLIEMWKDVSLDQGVALLAPNAAGSAWPLQSPDPAFIARLVDKMRADHDIDEERIYLFGHSSGAAYAMLLLNRAKGPWRAAALHAGYVPLAYLKPPETPKAFRHYIGAREHIFSLDEARGIGQALAEMGHDNELAIIPGHTHWLYQAGPQIARDAWHYFETQAGG